MGFVRRTLSRRPLLQLAQTKAGRSDDHHKLGELAKGGVAPQWRCCAGCRHFDLQGQQSQREDCCPVRSRISSWFSHVQLPRHFRVFRAPFQKASLKGKCVDRDKELMICSQADPDSLTTMRGLIAISHFPIFNQLQRRPWALNTYPSLFVLVGDKTRKGLPIICAFRAIGWPVTKFCADCWGNCLFAPQITGLQLRPPGQAGSTSALL
jgi:hypothetical protein